MKKICEGDTVVLRVDDGENYFVLIKKTSTIKIRKKYYHLSALIGEEYFSWFEFEHDKKILKKSLKNPEEESYGELISNEGRDNRNINDDGNGSKVLFLKISTNDFI
jgi:hypothetical protein